MTIEEAIEAILEDFLDRNPEWWGDVVFPQADQLNSEDNQ